MSIYVLDQPSLHCNSKQYIVSKLSASSIQSVGLNAIYSRLTNEDSAKGSWSVAGTSLHRDDQFIQVRFINLYYRRFR